MICNRENGIIVRKALECVFGYLMMVVLLLACNSENAPDCFQNAGDLVSVQVDVPEFSNITVFERLNLVLIQGEERSVEIESGEFLVNEISATVEGDRLLLRNENGCNLFREYGLSTVYVTAPNINEIRSSTGLLVSSEGILNYPNLRLVSESFTVTDSETTSGSFDLQLEAQDVQIVVNGIAYFRLQGTSESLNVNVAAGDSRIEAEGLSANIITVNHRGTNDIVVNPQESISGIIRGYGDVISINRPEEIMVEETFEGRLIIRD